MRLILISFALLITTSINGQADTIPQLSSDQIAYVVRYAVEQSCVRDFKTEAPFYLMHSPPSEFRNIIFYDTSQVNVLDESFSFFVEMAEDDLKVKFDFLQTIPFTSMPRSIFGDIEIEFVDWNTVDKGMAVES